MSHITDTLISLPNAKAKKLYLKEVRSHIDRERKQYSKNELVEIQLPVCVDNKKLDCRLLKCYRSSDFLVQVYMQSEHVRISVNRVQIYDNGHWHEGISWDDLMWIKRKIGYGDMDAVEVYPRDEDLVNVANIRHLFILNKGDDYPFIWRN